MGEISPAKLAMMILKINVFLFTLTLVVNLLGLFPYFMHINHIANNIALDVANKNYILKNEVEEYVGHLKKTYGEEGAVTYSIQTFKESENVGDYYSGSTDAASKVGVSERAIFVDKLRVNAGEYYSTRNGDAVVAVGVRPLKVSSGKNLIVGDNSFDPMNKNMDIVRGMTGQGLGNNAILIQRGNSFEVEVKTRYKLSAGFFGYMMTYGLPINVKSVGVTTKYYQYDV